MQFLVFQEKLILSREQEILREHGRWERAIANHGTPLSVCTILRDEEIYNFTEDQVRLVCSTLSILFCDSFLFFMIRLSAVTMATVIPIDGLAQHSLELDIKPDVPVILKHLENFVFQKKKLLQCYLFWTKRFL